MVIKQQSHNSLDGIGEVFATIFFESDIAKTNFFRKDKTTHITRFGLADLMTSRYSRGIWDQSWDVLSPKTH